MQWSKEVLVMDHAAWQKKDRQGKKIEGEYDCQVKIGFAIGQPAVTFYVSEEVARQLADATGQSFQKQGRAPFQPYPANATFEQYVRSSTTEGSKYVNTQLATALRSLEPIEASSRRRAAA